MDTSTSKNAVFMPITNEHYSKLYNKYANMLRQGSEEAKKRDIVLQDKEFYEMLIKCYYEDPMMQKLFKNHGITMADVDHWSHQKNALKYHNVMNHIDVALESMGKAEYWVLAQKNDPEDILGVFKTEKEAQNFLINKYVIKQVNQ